MHVDDSAEVFGWLCRWQRSGRSNQSNKSGWSVKMVQEQEVRESMTPADYNLSKEMIGLNQLILYRNKEGQPAVITGDARTRRASGLPSSSARHSADFGTSSIPRGMTIT